LFPLQDDLPHGTDLRKNLICVPACDEHNSEKSTDDEFLLWMFSLQSLGNQYRSLSFHTKTIQAFRDRPNSFLAVLENPTAITLLAPSGQLVPSASVEVDFARFERCMTHIAKALYFEETRRKWKAACTVCTNIFQGMRGTGSNGLNDLHHKAISAAQGAMIDLPSKGQNPAIFSYKFGAPRSDMTLLLMSYYEEIQVLVRFPGDA
jgi:hypothetical protein